MALLPCPAVAARVLVPDENRLAGGRGLAGIDGESSRAREDGGAGRIGLRRIGGEGGGTDENRRRRPLIGRWPRLPGIKGEGSCTNECGAEARWLCAPRATSVEAGEQDGAGALALACPCGERAVARQRCSGLPGRRRGRQRGIEDERARTGEDGRRRPVRGEGRRCSRVGARG